MSRQPAMFFAEMRLDRRIDVDDPVDCEIWARYFEVTLEDLHEAVRAVGTMGDEVRCFLGRERRLFF